MVFSQSLNEGDQTTKERSQNGAGRFQQAGFAEHVFIATQWLRDQILFPKLRAEVHVNGLFVTGKS